MAVTRLGGWGGPRRPFGDFSGKAEQVIVEPVAVGQGGRIYPYPRAEKKRKVIPQPLPEYEISGPLSRDRRIENASLPAWDQEAWEASLKTLAHLEAEDRKTRQKKTESALIVWLVA